MIDYDNCFRFGDKIATVEQSLELKDMKEAQTLQPSVERYEDYPADHAPTSTVTTQSSKLNRGSYLQELYWRLHRSSASSKFPVSHDKYRRMTIYDITLSDLREGELGAILE